MAKLDSGLRWCTYGKHWINTEMFPPDSHRNDGIASFCKPCRILLRERLPRKKQPRYTRERIKEQAMHAVNHAVSKGKLKHPREIGCAHCRHAGEDRRHEYHHHNGYSKEHWLDVVCLCSGCHKIESRKERGLKTFVLPTA